MYELYDTLKIEGQNNFTVPQWADGDVMKVLREISVLGEFCDQGGARWKVIRRSLWGHNDTPFGRVTPGRSIGHPGVGRPKGVSGVFLVTINYIVIFLGASKRLCKRLGLLVGRSVSWLVHLSSHASSQESSRLV
jgi:hypothetical protein